jgi:hypothetical protein
MAAYHGRWIRFAGLSVFSRSCSGRIVGNTEAIDSVTQSAHDQIVSASGFSPALKCQRNWHLTAQIEFSFYERYFNP